jgi:hypothetical protein
MSEKDRPGIELPMELHWKEYWVINCVCMLNMLPNDVALKFKAMYKLSELAEAMLEWEPGRLLAEMKSCEAVLREQEGRITWWLDEEKVHFDYNVGSIGNN